MAIVCLSLEWFENQNALEHYVANVVKPALIEPQQIELSNGSLY